MSAQTLGEVRWPDSYIYIINCLTLAITVFSLKWEKHNKFLDSGDTTAVKATRKTREGNSTVVSTLNKREQIVLSCQGRDWRQRAQESPAVDFAIDENIYAVLYKIYVILDKI